MSTKATQPRLPTAEVLPFFFLNHRLEPARLRAKILEMQGAGADGFFIHAREGLATPYLSTEWFGAVQCCIEVARSLRMKAWLYDEMPYPSGVAGGEVVRRRPEFVEQSLQVQQRNFAGGRRIDWKLGGGNVLACYARRRAGRDEVVELLSHVGPVADTWRKTSQMDSKLYYPTGPSEVFNCPRSICVLPENTLAVTLPRGSWEVVAVTMKTGGDLIEPFGQYVDVSNREATQLFMELTHEAYWTRFAHHFGKTVPGIFCDEPKFRNPLPWGKGVEEKMGKISPTLAFALAGEKGAAANEERRNYRRVAKEAFLKNWTMPLSQWCNGHRIALTGHISPEEEWWYESRHVGSVLANLRKFQVPGCDVIIPAAGDRKNAILNLTTSLAVSAAAQAGRPQVLCETFGACDFTLDLRTMKRMADWLAVAGINVIVPHGFFYSLDGYRKLDAPPSFAPPAFASADLAAWSEEFRRAAEPLGPGVAPDVLAIRPMDFLRGLPDTDKAKGDRLLTRAAKFATEMARRGLRLHWIDDDELRGVKAVGGRFGFGQCHYQYLVFFRDFTDRDTLVRLVELDGKGAVLDDRWALTSLRGPLQSDGDVHAARRSDGRWFVVNVGKDPATFSLRAAYGHLQGGESRIVDERVAATDPAPVQTLLRLTDEWQVTLPKRNPVYLHAWTLNGRKVKLDPAFVLEPGWSPVVGQTLFGPVPLNATLPESREWVYRTHFTVKGRPVLNLVCESGHMRGDWLAQLNGRALGAWRKTGDFLLSHPLAGALRPGRNQLEFHFTLRRSSDGLIGAPWVEGSVIVRPGGKIEAAGASGASATSATTRAELGLPYFGGPLRYTQQFHLRSLPGKPVHLRCEGFSGNGGAVRVNGVICGTMRWAPADVDVTKALRRGNNRLEIDWRGSPVTLTGRVDPSRPGGRVKLVTA
ncbi:MAG: hypothetical protein ABI222_12470 [Opitutaceae bacterium]